MIKLLHCCFLVLSILLSNSLLAQDKLNSKKVPSKKILKTDIKQTKNLKDEDSDDYLELFDEVFSILKRSYVDSISNSEVILSGIRGMMSPLDPHTKILMGKSKDNYEVLARGKYGGVGMKISEVRDTIIIVQVFEDSPSYFEGLMAGDMILKIDSTSTIGLGRSGTVKLLKGEVDTPVTVQIFRKPGKIKKEFTLRRSNIQVKNIPYWGLSDDKIGYIKLTRFSKNTSKDFKEALIDMSENDMKGLIIDLRSNGGGLLRESINILDMLLPKDKENPLLIKKGKASYKEYFSSNNPVIDIDLPIIVLQNKRSASASEIVAGALQDLDRAIISGQNSYGKGLVQMTNKLNDTISVKITTAKYYLPSGRIIQKSNYLGNNSLTDGLDELTDGLDRIDSTFYTAKGRKIKGGRGIIPDISTNIKNPPAFITSLSSNNRLFLSFANDYGFNITENAFILYEKLLKHQNDDDYLLLDSNIFAINLLKDTNNYHEKIINNKKRLIDLTNKYLFLQDIGKLYKQLNRYERFHNLTYNNINEVITYGYMFRNYLSKIDSKEKRPINELKKYLIDNNLYINSKSDKNKKIADHSLYQILSKLLNILSELPPRDLSDIEDYLFDIEYMDIKNNLDKIQQEQKNLSLQILLQSEVVEWYIKILYNKIVSPHKDIPLSQSDKEFILKHSQIKDSRKKIIDNLKKFVETHDFDYKVESELEFDRLKKKILASSDFENNNDLFKKILKKSKYNKLFKGLDKYIERKKNKYFYQDTNSIWLVNMVLREYSRIAMSNDMQVKTSLHVDTEYYDAVGTLNDIARYNRILSAFSE
tara:strand:+ start:653 stop:3103 length:2451 start_codon:yes stop_codon:yes gene_type:complete